MWDIGLSSGLGLGGRVFCGRMVGMIRVLFFVGGDNIIGGG